MAMGRRRALALAGVAAVLTLTGCYGNDRDPPPRTPELPQAAPLPQFALNVAELGVISAYASAPGAGAESAVPFSPKTALELWAKTHVRAAGRRGRGEIVIRDASITAKKVPPVARNWRDWFRRQPVERYDAVLELELQIRDDGGSVRARTLARATHTRFLMDDFRDYERERITQLQLLTDEIIAAALKRLDAELHANMREWVR
jgi:hypothetical protein